MGVISTPCPDCGGQIHKESFVGDKRGNHNAYAKYSCIGDKNLSVGVDGVYYTREGCSFRAKHEWNSETNETKRKTVSSKSLDTWAEWVEYIDEHK